jgi:TetR/AcrR family transcriptional regulator, mexJK operon transcriptional repressor
MSTHPKRRGPGRPRDLAKLEAILDAADALFHERGVTATTMDAVAERASVSKMTVYANFRDKPALLSAVVGRKIKLVHVFDLAVGPDLNSSVERLVELGELVASAAGQPEAVRMVRLMMECADEHPRALSGSVLHRRSRRTVEANRSVPESSDQARILID